MLGYDHHFSRPIYIYIYIYIILCQTPLVLAACAYFLNGKSARKPRPAGTSISRRPRGQELGQREPPRASKSLKWRSPKP